MPHYTFHRFSHGDIPSDSEIDRQIEREIQREEYWHDNKDFPLNEYDSNSSTQTTDIPSSTDSNRISPP